MAINQTDRPRFYEQQYLGSADLAALVDYERMARARHDLGAHSWGIAAGLQLFEKPTKSGDVDVYVQPGYAWDGFGRALTVLAPYKIPSEPFKSIAFTLGVDDGNPPGHLVDVWLAFTATPRGGPSLGFEACSVDDQYARIFETFQIVVGEKPGHSDRHAPVTVGVYTVDAEQVQRRLGAATDPPLVDESVAYQTFPDNWDRSVWLVPLGAVRWRPPQNTLNAGSFVARTASDIAASGRKRRYSGVVAETVDAARGFVRVRSRDAAAYAPTIWNTDTEQSLLWVEGSLRVEGDAKLLAGQLILRDAANNDSGRPLTIRRRETNGMAPQGSDLWAQIGSTESGANRFVVGPVTGNTAADFKGRFVVKDDGDVGIGTLDPKHRLEIHGEDNALVVVSDAATGSARNAGVELRTTAADGVTYIDFTKGSTDLTGSGTPDFSGRLSYNEANTGAFSVRGGKIGIETTAPTNQLHVNHNSGLRINRLYMSGGNGGNDGWSSLAFNAFHNDANTAWTFPDPSRRAITVEMDDWPGFPRFQVYSTTNANMQGWIRRLSLDGETGNLVVNESGGSCAVGLATAECKLHVAGSTNGDAGTVSAHIAVIDNQSAGTSSDVLALRIGAGVANAGNNFITFFAGANDIGAVEGNNSNGVTYQTTFADYAEWLERDESERPMRPGDVVGVFAGRLRRATDGADHILVISTAPAVVANRPAAVDRPRYEKVAMLGQVPIMVRGPVSAGDLIVPSGDADGAGVAVRPADATLEQHATAVGLAWQTSRGAAPSLVRCAVGLTSTHAWRSVLRSIHPTPAATADDASHRDDKAKRATVKQTGAPKAE
jgi:hypothetical protein